MAKVVISVKLEPELAEWVAGYAGERGVSKNALLESAVINMREDARVGVPDLHEAVERQAYSRDRDGVGECPKRDDGGKGHVWAGWRVDPSNPCKFCGASGREFFAAATAERVEVFAQLETPKSIKSWGKQS